MKSHYYKTKMLKMGEWDLLPADTETWHGEYTNKYFKKLFGIPKGLLMIMTLEDGKQHAYVPVDYLKLLYKTIDNITKKDYRGLEKKLNKFYSLRKKLLSEYRLIKNLSKLTNKQLIKIYQNNRDWCHRVAVFDQLAWLGEDYWMPIMKNYLTENLKLKYNSKEYLDVLFKLTKPEEISTTLREQKQILSECINIKLKKQTIKKATKKLAKSYGWMPVFTYGDSWDEKHYKIEIEQLLKKDISILRKRYNNLVNYKNIRNKSIKILVQKYKIKNKDLQIFVDFGKVLDTRNEGEYLVSYLSFYLMFIYKEIAKRLVLSVKQVRTLYEKKIISCLRGIDNAHDLLNKKGKIIAYGYDKKMEKRINFSAKESKNIFTHLESYVENIQGSDENKGLCANIGEVIGIAKILYSVKEMKKVKKGDILIANTTSVDSLPAMKRAAAFVTEIGGLTCHAAVVSREFNVPCIVSLKNATKNFKDGDKIKVDATNGIVKKIK